MRRAVVATATVAGATLGLSFVVNGLGQTPGVPGPFRPPAASAAGLTAFDDCDELLAWYVDRTLPHVGPYGLDGIPYYPQRAVEGMPVEDLAGAGTADDAAGSSAGSSTRELGSAGSPDSSQSSSDSGTNVQEVGVDEPDIAKTDGEVVVRVVGQDLVVTDVSSDEARELARLRMPVGIYSPELLLAGDRVLVLQSGTSYVGIAEPMEVEPPITTMPEEPMVDSVEPVEPVPDVGRTVIPPLPTGTDTTRLLEVSIADPTEPRVLDDQTFGGTTVTARQYDDASAGDGGADGATVRLVLRTDRPTIDWVQPDRSRSASEAKEANKELVRASTIEDWLPTVGTGDDRRPLVECSDVRHPATDPGLGFGTVTVVSLPADDIGSWRSTAVTAGGETVYSSPDRLYLATASGADGEDGTDVHAFSLEGDGAEYAASGHVEGHLRDRWSMDEQDGVLRLAVGYGDWTASENGIVTLRQQGDRLVPVGEVRGLGPDEQIQAVRWFDDLAVVVTFRQTDPLYTVDLSDPERPRALGALKIPGFSRYLHPIGDDRLLGIGQDADLDGMTRGAQAAVFDIGDLTDPRRLATLSFGDSSHADAEDDPRAFTWLADSATALTSVTDYARGGSRVAALRVSPDGDLDEVESWSLPQWGSVPSRTLPLGGDRVALVSGDVRVVTVG